ncbi:MAG: FxDxF family PEP-CTERM protein [Pontixanthobacter sp.]
MKTLTKLMAAASVATLSLAAAPAMAADFFPGDVDGGSPSGFFFTNGDPFDGSVTASFGRAGLGSGTFTDRFLFRLGQNGLGSGSITTALAGPAGGRTDLDFNSVTLFNGVTTFVVPITRIGGQEEGFLQNVPIFEGVQNILSVNYTSRGNGSFGGQLSFVPTAAVPEPATWALMLLGFAGIGFSMRRRPKDQVRVKYAF